MVSPTVSRPRYNESTDQNGSHSLRQPARQEDTYSIIQRQADRIAMLEARLARSEPMSSSFEPLHGQSPTVENPNSSRGRFDNHLLTDLEGNRRPPDTVAIGGEDAFVFRGEGFKTQFYGPSSPMSAILNSHLILKLVRIFSGCISCINFSSALITSLEIMILSQSSSQRLPA